jgi:hypothetical protein
LRIAPSPVNKKFPSSLFAMRSWSDQVVSIARASTDLPSPSPSPLFIVGGQTGCLSGHQGLVESAVVEPERPVIEVAALFAGPSKRRLEWTKLRCQAVVRLTAANKALAFSESSRSVHNPPLTPVLLHPYNTFSCR